jgi:PAS domain S-box-containing protein
MGTITTTALVLASIITERQKGEDLRVRLAGIVESSEDAIFSKNLQGLITSWNGGAERLFGHRADDVIGKSDSLIIPPPRVQQEISVFERTRRGESVEHYETLRLAKDGRLVDVSLTLSPVRDASGIIVGASLIARDITQRKKAEAALRVSEALFRQLADAMPQIVWAARPDGYIDYYNRRWYDFTGFQESYGDESWKPILHPEDVQRCLEVYFQCIKTEQPYEIEYRFKDRKTNGYRWFLGRALPVRDEAGNVIRWFGTCTDIDAQKSAEAALAQAKEILRGHTDTLEKRVQERTARLQETIHSLDSFCYSIAHDLRAPLRALSGFSIELFTEYRDKLDETGKEYLDRIKDAASRMDRLILDLLELGRLNTLELPTEPVALDPIIRKALIPLESTIHSTHARIQISQPLMSVRASPVILDQIIANLLGNALKFIPPGVPPEIEIWTEQRDENVRLSVRDNGIGMKRTHLQKIFLPFVRLVNGGAYPGTGIGLAIVRKGAERMGGRVGVESEPGKGSCFWIELPLAIQA